MQPEENEAHTRGCPEAYQWVSPQNVDGQDRFKMQKEKYCQTRVLSS